MVLNVPTNWDERIIDKIQEINESDTYRYKVGQVYGATLTDIGSGRLETPVLPDDVLRKHIESIQRLGVKFNFIANSPSLGGKEHDRRYRQQILDTISWMSELGVDMITVSIPFLGELINEYFPHIKVKLSTMLDVRSVQNIELLEPLGPKIYSITVSRFINRDFKLLKEILNAASFEIELLANSLCLLNCPYQMYHSDLVCWQARSEKGWEEPFTDYRSMACDMVRLKEPSQVIKSPWIRPDDLEEYESIGIHSIKIAGRTFPTEWILYIIDAYANGYYDGNLWDLIIPFLPIYVDNQSLNGFLQHFKNHNLNCSTDCKKCNYCEKIANKSVKYKDEAYIYLEDLEERLYARIHHDKNVSSYFKESRV